MLMYILRKLVLDPPIHRDSIGGIDEVPRGVASSVICVSNVLEQVGRLSIIVPRECPLFLLCMITKAEYEYTSTFVQWSVLRPLTCGWNVDRHLQGKDILEVHSKSFLRSEVFHTLRTEHKLF